MIKTIEEFKEITNNFPEGTLECQCEKCGKVFTTTKSKSKNPPGDTTYYRLRKSDKLYCPGCAMSTSFKLNRANKSKQELDKQQQRRTLSRNLFFSNKNKEDTQIFYKSFYELEEAFKEGRMGGKFICTSCGEEFLIPNRDRLRYYIKHHRNDRTLTCKGCSITSTKIKHNFNKISTSNKVVDCHFKEGQEYEGADLESRKENRKKYKFVCDICGKEFEAPFATFSGKVVACPDCHKEVTTSVSADEKELLDYIKSIYSGIVLENNRDIIPPHELDIYLPDAKIAIEYDGLYWHSMKKKNYHITKTLKCEELGIILIHITSEDWRDKKDYVKGILYSYLTNGPYHVQSGDVLDRRYFSPIRLPEGYVAVDITKPKKYYTNGTYTSLTEKRDYKFKYYDCGTFKVSESKTIYQSWNTFKTWDFPYQNFTDEELKKEWKHLIEADGSNNSSVSSKIIRQFHPSLYSYHLKGKISPVQYWNYLKEDYGAYQKLYNNRMKYATTHLVDLMREDGLMRAETVREGLSIMKVAPCVSYFKPGLAKYLINKYLSEYNTVFDPFSGFSGRMLGTCSLGKKYIGQDINEKIVEESNNIISYFNLNASVIEKDIFESKGEYDCLFTCPPYNNKEIWGDDLTDKSCDDWIDECLFRFKCRRYLFVVDNTDKYKDYIVEEISNRSHLSNGKELVVLI